MFNRNDKMPFRNGAAQESAVIVADVEDSQLDPWITLPILNRQASFLFAHRPPTGGSFINGVAMLLFLFALATTMQGQEALRMSMASAEAAEARRKAAS